MRIERKAMRHTQGIALMIAGILCIALGFMLATGAIAQTAPSAPTIADFTAAYKTCSEQVEAADKNVRALQVSLAVQLAQKDVEIAALKKQVAELTPKPVAPTKDEGKK